MDVITLDWETFYDRKSGYSLSEMSTEEYVTDPRFETIGVSVMVNDAAPRWFSGTHEEIADWLGQFDIHKNAMVAHHMVFDGLVAEVHYGIVPRYYVCTESMVRPFLKPLMRSLSLAKVTEHLGLPAKGDAVVRADGKRRADFTPAELAEYAAYCDHDTWLCRQIFKWARPQLTWTEMQVLDTTLRMYLRPQLYLDAAVFEAGLKEVRSKKAQILAEMEVMGITGATLRSNDKFAELLRERGIDPPMKPSPTSIKKGEIPPKMTYAFSKSDPEFIELREEFEDDLEVSMLLNARISEKSTMEERRGERMLALAQTGRKFRVPVNYYGAHTGRYTAFDKINPLNLPKPERFELNADGTTRIVRSKLRHGLRAPPGYMVLAPDKSQIECRINATLAGQESLVRLFREGGDPYSDCASGLFGRPVSKALAKTDDIAYKDRNCGKAIILGFGFGMSGARFKRAGRKDGLLLSDFEAQQYIDFARQRYSDIPGLWSQYDAALRTLLIERKSVEVGPVVFEWVDKKVAGIRLPNNLHILYPNLRGVKNEDGRWEVVCNQARDKFPRRLWGGAVCENVVQTLARNLIVDDMAAIEKELGYRAALQVYDEIVLVVPEKEVEQLAEASVAIMSRSPDWLPDLPVAAEAGFGPTYGDC